MDYDNDEVKLLIFDYKLVGQNMGKHSTITVYGKGFKLKNIYRTDINAFFYY